jgi:hypothetical protein
VSLFGVIPFFRTIFPAKREEKEAASAACAERKYFLMEHVSHKDKQKEEVCPEKRRDQRQLLSVSQPPPWWKCLFPNISHEFLPAERGKWHEKWYDPFTDHIRIGRQGECIPVIERLKPGRETSSRIEHEYWLTPDMQRAAIDFWQRHNVAFTLPLEQEN